MCMEHPARLLVSVRPVDCLFLLCTRCNAWGEGAAIGIGIDIGRADGARLACRSGVPRDRHSPQHIETEPLQT